MILTRNTLLERAKDPSNKLAWNDFVQVYSRFIYMIVRSLGINQVDSEDITQNTLIKIWKYIPQYQYRPEHARFRTWVGKIARSQAMDYLRKLQSQNNLVEALQHENAVEDSYQMSSPEIDASIEGQWKIYVANLALKNLQSKFSNNAICAFEMYSKGKTVGEISDALAVKPDSVYKYISRVRFNLIQEVQRIENEYDAKI